MYMMITNTSASLTFSFPESLHFGIPEIDIFRRKKLYFYSTCKGMYVYMYVCMYVCMYVRIT